MREGGCTIREEYGALIRLGYGAWERMEIINKSGTVRMLITGSMVELYFDSPVDLLNDDQGCYFDEDFHIVGAREIRIVTPEDVVKLASAVERRTMKGTRMNDSSSRSHCITILKCVQINMETGMLTTSRLSLFDMMGSERTKGENSAHDTKNQNWKKSESKY